MADGGGDQEQARLERLAWLVESRNKIQERFLDIYVLLKTNHAEIGNDNRLGPIVGRLAGVAFSLWRAVFLADVSRSWPTVLVAAEDFLEVVMKDNAINYTQDVRYREYSFGYYINNAKHRIRELRDHIHGFGDALNEAGLGGFPDMSITNKDGNKLWDAAYEALVLALDHCRKSYSRPLAVDAVVLEAALMESIQQAEPALELEPESEPELVATAVAPSLATPDTAAYEPAIPQRRRRKAALGAVGRTLLLLIVLGAAAAAVLLLIR